jgi:hypothetical protein
VDFLVRSSEDETTLMGPVIISAFSPTDIARLFITFLTRPVGGESPSTTMTRRD